MVAEERQFQWQCNPCTIAMDLKVIREMSVMLTDDPVGRAGLARKL